MAVVGRLPVGVGAGAGVVVLLRRREGWAVFGRDSRLCGCWPAGEG